MNAIVLAILVMVALCLARVSVVFSLVVAALVGGLWAGMSVDQVIGAFNEGLGSGATVALAYATLGAFAVALSRTGITELVASKALGWVGSRREPGQLSGVKWLMFAALIIVGAASGTVIPVHIAFIPILVPPLLGLMSMLKLDRRAVACVITFSITIMYMTTPVGFGTIFLNDILTNSVNQAGDELGMHVTASMAPKAMLLPALGMLLGLGVAVLFSYRRPREYQQQTVATVDDSKQQTRLSRKQLFMILAAIAGALIVQLMTGSMVLGGLLGFALLSMNGLFKWKDQDDVFTQGMRLMALVGFIMIAASGFAGVMKASGAIPELVAGSGELIGNSPAMAALVMLLVGLFITMGIGSSFSTIPIIAAIYVPLAVSFGFSPLATLALVGTAGALGDAGSPASDSTLGPTAGLNADGQHDHIRDSVIPTFIHYNIPLVIFGWIAAQVL
ncbi:Na+/H+ antiporter family protein [Oceanisphaera psychrotolerans]|uniref:Sodium:proton antiporter n=1 Tax=Oceanisphaera psychrotolerans TaxID=1414654 RepID=A0A1J4QEG9_9GAMM|nr:Na+/H+ antiporter NhaC family protein [Oceanisphaera psychrotolerans]OIN12171.1 sodium:proton antiporter [Oceanisphaera psychrotolerans]